MTTKTKTKTLEGCKVAMLAMDGFEEAELVEPKRALSEAGALVHVISSRKPDDIPAFNQKLIAQLEHRGAAR